MACRGGGGSRVRLAAAEEPAVAERAAEREPSSSCAAASRIDALGVDEPSIDPAAGDASTK